MTATVDANGQRTTFSYNDQLNRLKQVVRAATDTATKNQSSYSYDDTALTITATSDLNFYPDNLLKTVTKYDGLGRMTETQTFEDGTNYIATQQQYDTSGRVFKTSNPFRTGTPVWTTTTYDALGRVLTVTTPDNAVVSTSYNGTTVTVTDQAGKKRKIVTDALGRLSDVWEDPNGLNHQTTYLYDTLDNLIKVTQGSQQRFFMYDSLKRLLRSRNPEQSTHSSLNLSDPLTGNSAWSIGYEYDENGNLTKKTDARAVYATYVYDALNRNTEVNYSDTPFSPDVKRFYDGATGGKGLFWYDYKGDETSANNVEKTTIDSYDALGRPLTKRQSFKLNNVWNDYSITRTYNRAGGVLTQTYPAPNQSVVYTYDSAGRTASFSSNLGGVQRTYASSFLYSARNQVTQELFGSQTALYHKLQYNIRGQLWDVRVSTGADVNGSWNRGCLQFFYDGTYSYGGSGTDNNGNVLKTKHYVPLDEQSNTWAIHDQTYGYDSLNRISSVAEYFNSNTQPLTQQSLQSYAYDRWGNRTINAAQTWGTGINNKQFNVDTATNRLGVPSGQTGVMSYDAAGNLITDTYSGAGARTYDAENRMTTAADYMGQTSRYTYDADGQRTRRQVAGGQEEWQVYGFDGELLAEYPASAPPSVPEKEYGYRNGQLLVIATLDTVWSDDAVPAGAVAAGDNESWNWVSSNPAPFSGATAHQSNIFAGLHQHYFYGATATLSVGAGDKLFAYVYLDPSNMPSQIMLQWAETNTWWEHRAYWGANNIPWGVDGTNSRRYMGPLPAAGGWVRLEVPASLVGLEGYTVHGLAFSMWGGRATWDRAGKTKAGPSLQWLVTDHLGTRRMIVDETGSLANVKRHDYLPFGEELFAGTGGRTTSLGYTGGDAVRQQFTQKERDVETGLDYFLARYYSSTQGRFTGVDPYDVNFERQETNDPEKADRLFKAHISEPQHWNHYSYALNNPLRYVDPLSSTLGS